MARVVVQAEWVESALQLRSLQESQHNRLVQNQVHETKGFLKEKTVKEGNRQTDPGVATSVYLPVTENDWKAALLRDIVWGEKNKCLVLRR